MSWNKDGEIIYKGETLERSNITNLLTDILSKKKLKSSLPMHLSIFTKILNEVDVPKEWVKDTTQRALLEATEPSCRRNT